MAGCLFFLAVLVLAASASPVVSESGISGILLDLVGEGLNNGLNLGEKDVKTSEELLTAGHRSFDGDAGSTEEIEGLPSELEYLNFDFVEADEVDAAPNNLETEGEERRLQEELRAMSAKDYVNNIALARLRKSVLTAGGLGRRVRKGRAKVQSSQKGKRRAKRGKRTAEGRLRAAIKYANKNPQLVVVLTLARDILLTSQLPLLVGTLYVKGSCKSVAGKTRACVIDGQNKYPIFRASIYTGPCQLTLQNLVLQNAKGGAYTGDPATNTAASCDFVARGVTFRNNVNTAGGAIYMLGTYNIQGCLFDKNTADGDGGAILAGDSIAFYLAPALGSYVSATGFIARSTFKNNRAGVRPSRWNLGYGGALAHFGGPTLKIRTSLFENNAVLSPGTNGGAIHFRAGDNITVVRSHFKGNSAPIGGAVYAAPLIQFKAWGRPVGPNIWGTARFCRTKFTNNVASKSNANVAVAGTYAFDIGKVKVLFCPTLPKGYGALDPAKTTTVAPKASCIGCYKA